jgi:lactate racemase
MAEIKIPYGKTTIPFHFKDENPIDLILPKENNTTKIQEDELLINGLKNCIGKAESSVFSCKDLTVSISVNDPTRPIPYQLILPKLLKKLRDVSISSKNISFFIATGTHKDLTKEEISELLSSEILKNYRTIVHNCDDEEQLTYLGESKKGTPIYINSAFLHHDIKIVVGHIEPHHFMGFSGGVKSAVIGLGGRITIEANHKMITDPNAKMGLFYSNPMRNDVEEIGALIGVDLAFNVVMNSNKKIIDAFYGDPYYVMEEGIRASKHACEVENIKKYDLVIASPGGFPKDINLYQSQKAITHACSFLEPYGVVLLVAECVDGTGSTAFQEYFQNKNGYLDVIKSFENELFRVGPHKAYQLALQLKKHSIVLLSSISQDIIKSMFLVPANSIEQAFSLSKSHLPENPKIAFLPFATHTMHKILEKNL